MANEYIPAEFEVRVESGYFPYQVYAGPARVATVYTHTLLRPIADLVVHTRELNRLRSEKDVLLQALKDAGLPVPAGILDESQVALPRNPTPDDPGEVAEPVEVRLGADIGSLQVGDLIQSRKAGRLYRVREVDPEKDLIVLYDLEYKWATPSKLSTVPKRYTLPVGDDDDDDSQ